MPSTIGFDATAAARQGAGIGRYARELLAALLRRQDDLTYNLYYCAGGHLQGALPPEAAGVKIRVWPVSDRVMNAVWHRARIPFPAQGIVGRFDLFHSPDFTLPPTWGRPTVLTVHDLAFLRVPDCAYPTLRDYLRKVVPRSARQATQIIAVSESTRRDVIEFLGVPEERVGTVLEAVSDHFRPTTDMDRARRQVRGLGVQEPYILTVGTLEPRKNYVRLLEAYALLRQRGVDHRLVVAGRQGWMYQPIYLRAEQLGLQPYISFVHPSEEQLVALYRAAAAFVFPSVYEGFGIPPLEALACGTPVACSSAASMREVVGDAAETFDPYDVEAMAEAVLRILGDRGRQADLRQRGPSRAALFSWDRAARETVSIYRQALDHA